MVAAPLMVIAAGGTGGHMFPAQALAEEMLARGWRVVLSTDPRGARYAGGFPKAVERRVVRSATIAQGSALSRVTAPLSIVAGVVSATLAMWRDRPAVVAGFGGYPALPAMVAATLLRVPRMLHEQNGVLGRVNRAFAPWVDLVACGTWPTKLPSGVACEHVGNPVRASVLARAGAPYVLSPGGRIDLLVIGGSQGAGLFSRVVPEALALVPFDLRDRIRLSQQVRPEDMDRVRGLYKAMEIEADLRGFFEDVPDRLAAASLVISRSGAGSVADISVVGRPSILIPFAAALDDHQTANAAGLVSVGGAFMIVERELTAEGLARHITEILSDHDGAVAMADAALAAGRPRATEQLASLIEGLAQKGTGK